MRTNIEIDDALLAAAMAATGLSTTREVIDKRHADARQLFGRIRWEGDLHRERLDEPEQSDPRA